MRIGPHHTDERVCVVAEIGNNHEGDARLAEELIHLAAASGADAVKFQTFDTSHYVTAADERRCSQLRRFELSRETFVHLKEVADRIGIVFFSTPFDRGSATFLTPLVPVFKVASGDITFLPLLEHIAQTGKPIILSTGAATLTEVEATVACVRRVWDVRGIAPDLALLHCVAAYPVPPTEANLAVITTLWERFPNCTIGYSDHTMGNDAAVAAVALGARIVEKHFTIRHDHSAFRDHQLSATPDEFRALVERIRMTETMLGSGEKVPQPCEVIGRVNIRRSIAAARDLPAGHVLRPEDITWVRPAGGTPPGREGEVLGRRLTNDVAAGMLIVPEHIAHATVKEAA